MHITAHPGLISCAPQTLHLHIWSPFEQLKWAIKLVLSRYRVIGDSDLQRKQQLRPTVTDVASEELEHLLITCD